MNRKDFQSLAKIRLSEAKSLLQAGFPNGSYYLAGYAVECALKACIARSVQRHDFPDKKNVDASHTHNLKELVRIARLEVLRLEQASSDLVFRNHWDIVQVWSEQSRYRQHEVGVATELVKAVGDPRHGVLPWIKLHW